MKIGIGVGDRSGEFGVLADFVLLLDFQTDALYVYCFVYFIFV